MSVMVALARVSRGYRDEDLFEHGEIFRAVESVLAQSGLDASHYGSAAWNPFGDLVRPGGRVVLKPNFVSSRNLHENLAGAALGCGDASRRLAAARRVRLEGGRRERADLHRGLLD